MKLDLLPKNIENIKLAANAWSAKKSSQYWEELDRKAGIGSGAAEGIAMERIKVDWVEILALVEWDKAN